MLRIIRTIWEFIEFHRNRSKAVVATAWESMVGTAYEELGDNTEFSFRPQVSDERLPVLVREIVERARREPEQKELLGELTVLFNLPEGEAFKSVDRALGGVARAASRDHSTRPKEFSDPIAAQAFDLAMNDPNIIDDIYTDWWRQWVEIPDS